MKKANKMFSILLLLIMTFGYGLSVVHAVETDPSTTTNTTDNTLTDTTASLSYSFTVEKVSEDTIEGTMVADVYVNVVSGTLSEITLNYNLINSTLVDVAPHNNYTLTHDAANQSVYLANAAGWTSADSKIAVARFTTKKIDTEQECGLEISVDGKEYKKVETTPATPTNPKTGSMIPVAVIIGGALLIAVVYVNNKKNTKMYKI